MASRSAGGIVDDQTPSARQFADGLASQLAAALAANNDSSHNPLTSSDPRTKQILLTLHALFPNELLPALDLLDRKLVLRLGVVSRGANQELSTHASNEREDILRAESASRSETHEFSRGGAANQPMDSPQRIMNHIYYVRSTRQQQSFGSNWKEAEERAVYHEIRIRAWTCSCPTFTFAVLAYAGIMTRSVSKIVQDVTSFGGLSRGDDLPICKHLLACFLAERCAALSGFVEAKNVSEQEAAGWAAGWAD